MAVRDDDDGFRATPPTRDNPLLSFARANVGLLVPVVAALIFVIRCVAVARGDVLIANILIATTTIGDAIRALASLILQLGLVLNTYVLLIVIGRRARLDRTSAGLAAASLVSYSAAGYLRGHLSWIDLIPYLIALNLSLLYLLRRVRGHPSNPRILSLVILIVGTILIAGLEIVGDTFWLPRERLDFQNEEAFTGYVLKDSGDYLVILKDRPRVIIERKKDTLGDRDFCHPEPTDEEPVSEKVQSNLPVCP